MNQENHLKTILNNLNGTALYVIGRNDRKVLYYNDLVREKAANVKPGIVCSEIWNHDCNPCPLNGIGHTGSKTITRFNKSFNKILDITATPIKWDDEDAFIISMAPHKQTEAEQNLELERAKLALIAARLYPRAISVNLTRNTYRILHDDLHAYVHPEETGIYDNLFALAAQSVHTDYRREFIRLFSRENLIRQYASGKREIHTQHRQLRVNNRYEWMETSAIMLDNTVTGDIIEVTLVRNIEDKKQKEIRLEEENRAKTELLAQTLKNTSMFEFYWYPEKNTVVIPHRMVEQWGTRECYKDVPFDMADDLIHNKDKDYFCAMFGKIRSGEKNATGSYRVKSGDWREVILSTISTNDDGKPSFVVGIVRDITQKKKTELENVKLQSIYDFTITRNYDCLLIWNVETDTYEARFSGTLDNPGMPLQGSNRKGIESFSRLFICDEDRPAFLKEINSDSFFARLRRQNEDIHLYFRCPQNGKLRHKELSFCYFDENRSRVLMTMRDIDDMVRKEEQSRSALEKAYQAAKSASEAKDDFLSRMSHDMRTPMNAIIGMAAIARTHTADRQRVADCMDKIDVSSRHLLNIINEVLDMSKLNSGKFILAEEAFNLSDLIQDLLAMVRADCQRQKHTLKVETGKVNNEKLVGDKQRHSEVLLNFLGNAIKYTPDGGLIKFDIIEQESGSPGIGCYQFIFTDNGIGISPEFQKKIFDPFERAQDSRINQIQGTGLGMSIASNIVNMMNGTIEVESEIGKGTRFTVTLDLTQQKTGLEPDTGFARYTILVADDDRENAENLCRLVRELGMKSDCAFSGKETLDKIRSARKTEKKYDAIILDWTMFDMNGAKIANAIHDEMPENAPAIIVSTDDWMEIGQEAKQAGIDAFLPGPLFKSRLASVIQTALRQRKEAGNPPWMKETGTPRFSGSKILLVEDNELNMEIATELISMTGASIETAINGKAALEKFMASPENYYDLIFMDIQMPVMNGHEATKAIRALDRNDAKTVPIVSMSANTFPDDIRLAKASGMDDHIPKPLDTGHLADIMKKWISPDKS